MRNVRLIDAINRSEMKNKIYDFSSFAQNFYLSVAKVKVRSWESNSKSPADMVAYSNDCAVLFP